ncbi:MAG: hypothetical protein PWP16_1936 [Eubacteriaceae bacterium]|jgi:hypothetical protein|nr:hypothetical protein [Eubacteriaceae bacterium]PLB85974.1 hypothetical protein C0T31_07890 [Dysgonamonadaceae bacterium]
MKNYFLKLFIVCASGLFIIPVQAQNKTVLLDVSHDEKAQYTKVNPQMFDQYYELVEEKLGVSLVVNEDKELDAALLAKSDVVIVLSPLSKQTLKNLTPIERTSLVAYVKNGGKLIFFTDEDHRMDIDAFGANDVVEPFGMKFGGDLDNMRDVMAISFIGEVIKGKYELPYSGSRELTGGIPLSVRNSPGAYVHGAYTKLDNGGKIAAFAETMVGLFMGGVEMKRSNGETITWSGKDDKQFMQELIAWMLE